MNDINNLRFILHVSDFHLTDSEEDLKRAQKALKSLTDKLTAEGIKVEYLLHTGDIIDSSDIYDKAISKLPELAEYTIQEEDSTYFDENNFKSKATPEQKDIFTKEVMRITEERFNKAKEVMHDFVTDLNVSFGNVIICNGNHDTLRPLTSDINPVHCIKKDDGIWSYEAGTEQHTVFQSFEKFLDELNVANCKKKHDKTLPISFCSLGQINALVLNTSWPNPKEQKNGYYCTRCDLIHNTINELSAEYFSHQKLNIVMAHKPIYEICEKARLSYKRYINTTFMSDIQRFLGDKGIYLCGDKHTRSIGGSFFHDIPHYICGEPLVNSKTNTENSEVEYNLLEIKKNELGMERKIHIMQKEENSWTCEIRPQDTVISKLFKLSQKQITHNAFEILLNKKSFVSWESICQDMYSFDKEKFQRLGKYLNNLYTSICKYRIHGTQDTLLSENIFDFVLNRITEQMSCQTSKNVLNIRGGYSSGKSTFLGILYIFLLYKYSIGAIDFIPAYFNMENIEVQSKGLYFTSVKDAFMRFTENIQSIAKKEHQSVCYILDGLDEQDCWSHTTEDSIGRCLLDILSKHENSWHIMSFSQHRLPNFKNTMPARKYNDLSDIMYFNPIDVREKQSEDSRFTSFVEAFLKIKKTHLTTAENTVSEADELLSDNLTNSEVENVCEVIRKFRRLTINLGFMHEHYNYFSNCINSSEDFAYKKLSVTEVYNYYIDRQHEICYNKLGYGFVDYAPAMAYLFVFKGYTYEKFKRLRENISNNCHYLKHICDNYDNIYQSFLFIKKHKDAREYLVALHYNRELRYYAEHPAEKIGSDSILNEYITRNISVLIRKLWNDTNKFVIACEQLLQREILSTCMLSMLIYCLAHLQIYAPIRDQLREKMIKKAEEILHKKLNKVSQEDGQWVIRCNDNSQKLTKFIDLSLLHSMRLFNQKDAYSSVDFIKSIITDRTFQLYNRQHQMLYYGDLSIRGEDKKRPLIPGNDIIYKGFDFHNCFNYLFVKLSSDNNYPLREFDMLTLWDLIGSRLLKANLGSQLNYNVICCEPDTFFYRKESYDKATEVIKKTSEIFKTYLSKNYSLKSSPMAPVYKYFNEISKSLKKIVEIREGTQHDKQIIDLINKTNKKLYS